MTQSRPGGDANDSGRRRARVYQTALRSQSQEEGTPIIERDEEALGLSVQGQSELRTEFLQQSQVLQQSG